MSTNKFDISWRCTYIVFVLQWHVCKKFVNLHTNKQKHWIEHFSWISYRVSTAQWVPVWLVSFAFALYKKQGARRLCKSSRHIIKGLYTYILYIGNNWLGFRFMVFNTTFNYISVISWWSVLFVEENHRSAASHSQTLSHHFVSSAPCLSGIGNHNVSGDRYW